MISKVNVGNAAINNLQQVSNSKNSEIQKNKSEENSKVETIKKSIQNGTYKIDLNKTAEKIADTLL
jgi:anti-sigma28 factor (negative regulator of flagellin synthesis)